MSAEAVTPSSPAPVEHAGFEISGSGNTAAEAVKVLQAEEGTEPAEPEEPPKPGTKAAASKAASELGKRGGKAAAKARAAAATATDEAPAKEGEEEPEPAAASGEEPAKGKPRNDPEARIAQLAEKRREAERRAEAAERRAEEAERRATARRAEDKPAAETKSADAGRPKPPDEPKLKDYLAQHEDYDDGVAAWTKDLLEHRERERQVKQQHETRAHAYARAVTSTVESFHKRMGEAVKADPKLMEVASDFAATLRPSFSREEGEKLAPVHVISDHILKSEHAPALLRHFAADGGVDGEEFQRIATLRTPTEIRLAMAKLEGRIERSDAATTDTRSERTASKAPPPVKSVTGAPSTATGPALREGEEFDQWVARQPRAATR